MCHIYTLFLLALILKLTKEPTGPSYDYRKQRPALAKADRMSLIETFLLTHDGDIEHSGVLPSPSHSQHGEGWLVYTISGFLYSSCFTF